MHGAEDRVSLLKTSSVIWGRHNTNSRTDMTVRSVCHYWSLPFSLTRPYLTSTEKGFNLDIIIWYVLLQFAATQ